MAGYGGRGPSMAARRKKEWQARYKMSPNRIAWIKTTVGEFIYYRHATPQEAAEEASEGVQPEVQGENGDTISLCINKSRGRPFWLNLSNMTEKELEGFKKVIDLACEAALPVCRQRDEDAVNAHAEGDDSYARLYRPVPQFFVREGQEREHGEGVRDGYDDISQRDASEIQGASDSGELRDASDGVAD